MLPKPLRELCQYLVQALDEDGFLEQEDIDAVCALGVPQEMVQQAVAALQALEPAGIAARDLPECLLLQLQRRPENTALAQRIAAAICRFWERSGGALWRKSWASPSRRCSRRRR